MKFAGIIFDFDGVLIDSEYEGNRHLAEVLTRLGHPTTPQHAMEHFMGLAGADFHAAVEQWIGRPLPQDFHDLRAIEDARAVTEGIQPIEGAVAFVHSLPPALPKAVASSSTMRWITAHLNHIGLAGTFGDCVYSGREHVARGKPAPDIYLHAASILQVPIRDMLIIEDSPVGVTGAVASGATVIGFCGGRHCSKDHGERLRALGVHHVARDFGEVARLVSG